MIPRYKMIIEWSDEDKCYIVTFPEFEDCKTHGESYEKAARVGQEVLRLLIESYQAQQRPLPVPLKYVPLSPRPNDSAGKPRRVRVLQLEGILD